jgi:hypothetical protein
MSIVRDSSPRVRCCYLLKIETVALKGFEFERPSNRAPDVAMSGSRLLRGHSDGAGVRKTGRRSDRLLLAVASRH